MPNQQLQTGVVPIGFMDALDAELSLHIVALRSSTKVSEWHMPVGMLAMMLDCGVYEKVMKHIESMCHKYGLMLISHYDEASRAYILRFERK
jgi:hypothetical protein